MVQTKAKKINTDVLFHPKKAKSAKSSVVTAPPRPASATPPVPLRRDSPPPAKTEVELLLDDPNFTDFPLTTEHLKGVKFSLMKLHDPKPGVQHHPAQWTGPVKLNRKHPKVREALEALDEGAAKPTYMRGADGALVYGPDGKPVLEQPKPDNKGKGKAKDGKDAAKGGKKPFKKKTRQVFLMDDKAREIRMGERYPWVLEDGEGNQEWVGRMEDADNAENRAFLSIGETGFQFIPAYRWYKFQKTRNIQVLGPDAVEKAWEKLSKGKELTQWVGGKTPSAATQATLQLARDGPQKERSRLKLTDRGADRMRLDDDDRDGMKRQMKELGQEGDMDEQLFEEDFADDDDHVHKDGSDEEERELEERLKRELRKANKSRDAGVIESDEEDDVPKLDKAGKALSKALKRREAGTYAETDEEISSDDEPPPPTQPVVQPPETSSQPTTGPGAPSVSTPPAGAKDVKKDNKAPVIPKGVRPTKSGSNPPSRAASPAIGVGRKPNATGGAPTPRGQSPAPGSLTVPNAASKAASRATSPAAIPPGMGNAVVAMRATSPHKPKAVSPAPGSRATSPVIGGPGSRATSPVNTIPSTGAKPKLATKRKASEPPSGAPTTEPDAPAAKKAKVGTPVAQAPSPSGTGPAQELSESMVIEYLRGKQSSTRDIVKVFGKLCKDADSKTRLTAIIKRVSTMKDGVITLKEGL